MDESPEIIGQIIARLKAAPEAKLQAEPDAVVRRIRGISASEKAEVYQVALSWRDDPDPWKRRMLGLFLYATGVKTVETPEEAAIRSELRKQFSNMNGNLEAYRQLEWTPAPDLGEIE